MDCEQELMREVKKLRRSRNKKARIEESKRDMARMLLASGHSYREVAEALEISIGSVHNILKEPHEKIAPLLNEIRARSVSKHLILADHFLNRITDYNVERAGLKDKVLCAAILTDKAMKVGLRFDAKSGKAEGLPD